LKSRAGNLCLDLNRGNRNVQMYRCHGGANQRWNRDARGNVRSQGMRGHCLDLNRGVKNIYLQKCHGQPNQKWDFFGQELRSRFGLWCVDWGHRNIYLANGCHGKPNQRFFVDGKGRWRVAAKKNMCLDYHTRNRNVYVSRCHNGRNQKWFFDRKQQLRTRHDSRCADVHGRTKNIYMHGCHGGPNQRFFWLRSAQAAAKRAQEKQSGGRSSSAIKGRDTAGPTKTHAGAKRGVLQPSAPKDGGLLLSKLSKAQWCMALKKGGGDVRSERCSGDDTQRWYFHRQQLKSRAAADLCLEVNKQWNDVSMVKCSGSMSQMWFHDGSGNVKSEAVRNKCLSLEPVGKNIWVYDCSDKANQKWDFFGEELRSRHGLACIEGSAGNMQINDKNCNGGESQNFIVDAKGRWRIAVKADSCLTSHPLTGNVFLKKCHNGKNQKWYLSGNGTMRTRYDGKCADVNPRTKNIYMNKKCTGKENQQFYWMRAAQAATKAAQDAVFHKLSRSTAKSDSFTYFSCRALPAGAPGVTVFDDPKATVARCFAKCKEQKGARYFGMTGGNKCWCSAIYFGREVSVELCDKRCVGDASETCGGSSGHSSVYVMSHCKK